jgi:hypothetical protein
MLLLRFDRGESHSSFVGLLQYNCVDAREWSHDMITQHRTEDIQERQPERQLLTYNNGEPDYLIALGGSGLWFVDGIRCGLMLWSTKDF